MIPRRPDGSLDLTALTLAQQLRLAEYLGLRVTPPVTQLDRARAIHALSAEEQQARLWPRKKEL